MPLEVNVYHGDDAGGPVDYTIVRATYPASAARLSVSDLAAGASRRYGIRTYDPSTGLEEQNTDAQVTIARNAAGQDISDRPAGPTAILATPRRGGAATVGWTYLGSPTRPDPDTFAIYISTGDIDYTDPYGFLSFVPRKIHFAYPVSGLVDGQVYLVAVRGLLGAADDGNTLTATFEAAGAGPRSVEDLRGVAVYQERGA